MLEIHPLSTAISRSPTIVVDPSQLAAGWQEGQISILAQSIDGKRYTESVSVGAYRGEVQDLYIPIIAR